MTESDALYSYYNQGREENRLSVDRGRLEKARTQELILRYGPPSPATILDVGGGAGVYALWMAQQNYRVHLVDLIPLHIEQAKHAAAQQPDYPLASAQVGDAQHLEFDDASMDAVLLLGPLYHLPDHEARLQTLREVYRVLKPGGVLLAATISRFGSLLDGFQRGFFEDDLYAELVAQVLVDGQHHNPTGARGYFTTAFFHHPDEIKAEVNEANFDIEAQVAIEGPAIAMPDFDRFWDDRQLRERLLRFLRAVESEPTMMGATGHILTVGRKK